MSARVCYFGVLRGWSAWSLVYSNVTLHQTYLDQDQEKASRNSLNQELYRFLRAS
jgi:hypothetical protein